MYGSKLTSRLARDLVSDATSVSSLVVVLAAFFIDGVVGNIGFDKLVSFSLAYVLLVVVVLVSFV